LQAIVAIENTQEMSEDIKPAAVYGIGDFPKRKPTLSQLHNFFLTILRALRRALRT
jgi:hypothetical protein